MANGTSTQRQTGRGAAYTGRHGAVAAALVVAAALAGCGTLREESIPAYRLHPLGFADPANPQFHGALLRRSGYPLAGCRPCHGEDFGGGDVGVPCAKCHPGGPTGCTTCHGQPPATGAHARHVPRFACTTCHPVPPRWDAPGHIDGKVDVVFSGNALLRGAAPRYEAGRCSDTYCHAVPGGTGAATAPSWTQGSAAAACGSCHGVPPAGHYGEACHVCHAQVVDAERSVVRPDLHVDGVVQVRDLSAGCASCHGPPQDLGGAHATHLGSGGLAGPVPCSECHIVPAQIGAPGHIDRAPGAELVFGPLASFGGLTPAFDGTRCANTYCHGGTLRGGGATTPSWRLGTGAGQCGGCHGVPMPDHYHGRCNECHGSVVNRQLEITDPTLHVNGRVDFGFAP